MEAENRVVAAEANVNFLGTSRTNHERDVSKLTTELAAAKARVVELERDATTAAANLNTLRTSAQ